MTTGKVTGRVRLTSKTARHVQKLCYIFPIPKGGLPAALRAPWGVGAGSLTRDDPSAFAPPPAFGPFRVLHQIGIGALGPVFRTYEPTRDRLIAVKVFRLDITPEQAHSLAEELSRAADAGLFHPSIVEPIAAGIERTVAYRAEEYVAAETLDVAMRHYAPAAIDKVLPFITQLAGAIDFARAAGVGHGALHPRDVFVTPEEARATGFGVVDALERVGLRAPMRRPYSAPERIDGREWGTQADVFSLAAIAYELLTGRRPPGTGPEIGSLTGAAAGDRAEALLRVLSMAMDEQPTRRYPTALAFAAALEAAGRGARSSVGSSAEPAAPAAAALQSAPPPRAEELAGTASIAVHPRLEAADDIAGEREEDEAHQVLMRRERAHAEGAAATTLFPSEDEPEAEADRFLIEAGAAASIDDPADRYQEKTRSGSLDLGPGREAAVDRAGLSREHPALVPAERSRMFPLAVMLAMGLLLGFALGYAVGVRGPTPEAAQTSTTNQTPRPTGTDFSEQAVAPPSAASRQQQSATPLSERSATPSEADRTTRPAAIVGRLVVRSTPNRAGVSVNGRWRGRTPLSVEKLPFGKYTVRIIQPGYSVAREDVELSPDDPSRTLSIRLQRDAARSTPASRPTTGETKGTESFTGSIYVDSRPRAARVLLDGRYVGTTPVRIPEVPIGSHVVRLELPDHKPWTASRQVTAGQTSRISGSLERVR